MSAPALHFDNPLDELRYTVEYANDLPVKYAKWDRDVCIYCGHAKGVTYDHVEPRASGAIRGPENFAPACRICNSQKGHFKLVVFMAMRANKLVAWVPRYEGPVSFTEESEWIRHIDALQRVLGRSRDAIRTLVEQLHERGGQEAEWVNRFIVSEDFGSNMPLPPSPPWEHRLRTMFRHTLHRAIRQELREIGVHDAKIVERLYKRLWASTLSILDDVKYHRSYPAKKSGQTS